MAKIVFDYSKILCRRTRSFRFLTAAKDCSYRQQADRNHALRPFEPGTNMKFEIQNLKRKTPRLSSTGRKNKAFIKNLPCFAADV
jgi:hypothetical protein